MKSHKVVLPFRRPSPSTREPAIGSADAFASWVASRVTEFSQQEIAMLADVGSKLARHECEENWAAGRPLAR